MPPTLYINGNIRTSIINKPKQYILPMFILCAFCLFSKHRKTCSIFGLRLCYIRPCHGHIYTSRDIHGSTSLSIRNAETMYNAILIYTSKVGNIIQKIWYRCSRNHPKLAGIEWYIMPNLSEIVFVVVCDLIMYI